MQHFGRAGIPASERQFREWRAELRTTTGGPEAEVAQVCRSLRQHIRLLEDEVQQLPEARTQLRCQNIWDYLYHCALQK